jgi:hypothetical protein
VLVATHGDTDGQYLPLHALLNRCSKDRDFQQLIATWALNDNRAPIRSPPPPLSFEASPSAHASKRFLLGAAG